MPVLTDPQGWFTLHVPDGWDMAIYARPVGAAGGLDEVDGLVRSVRLYHSVPVF